MGQHAIPSVVDSRHYISAQSQCIPCRCCCTIRSPSPPLPFLLASSPSPKPTSNKNLSPSSNPLHPLFHAPTLPTLIVLASGPPPPTISAFLFYSTHLNAHHIHSPPDVSQRKPCRATNLIGKPSYVSLNHLIQDPDEITPSYADHAARSLLEIWQDNYLSIHTTTKVATRPLDAFGPQGPIQCVWNPTMQCRIQQLPSPVSPSTNVPTHSFSTFPQGSTTTNTARVLHTNPKNSGDPWPFSYPINITAANVLHYLGIITCFKPHETQPESGKTSIQDHGPLVTDIRLTSWSYVVPNGRPLPRVLCPLTTRAQFFDEVLPAL